MIRTSPAPNYDSIDEARFAPLQIDDDVLIVYEEAGTIWLWAFPELMEWPHGEITWLFSPVADRHVWPGDLWGVDDQGSAITVETKRSTIASRNCRPFEDYVPFKAGLSISADQLLKEWERLYALESDYLARGCPKPVAGTEPGVLPYSSHRGILFRWKGLWESRIVTTIDPGGQYAERVRKNLETRRSRGNPAPHFVGLITVAHHSEPGLSSKGRADVEALQEAGVEDARLHLLALRARVAESGVNVERLPSDTIRGWKE